MRSLLLVLIAFATASYAGSRRYISTTSAPSGVGGSTQGLVDEAGFLTTGIQFGQKTSSGPLVSGGAKGQMRQAMANVATVFEAAGYNLTTDAMDCWLYGFNSSDFGAISGVYDEFFPTLNHPARNPTGAGIVVPNLGEVPAIGVQCRGYPNGGLRVRPQKFFLSDFNAQAIVAGGTGLFTAGQLGINPYTGAMPGTTAGQVVQALMNLGIVYQDVMPERGSSAFQERVTLCQVMLNQSIFDSDLPSVLSAVGTFLKTTGTELPVVVRGYPANSLPLAANAAVTCPGLTTTVAERKFHSAGGVTMTESVYNIKRGGFTRHYHNLATSALAANTSMTTALKAVDEIFKQAAGSSTPTLASAGTSCEIISKLVDNIPAFAADYAAFFNKSSGNVSPPLVITSARFLGDDTADFALQCSGLFVIAA